MQQGTTEKPHELQKSSLPLQVGLRLEAFVVAPLYCLWALGSLLFKDAVFAPFSLTASGIALVIYIIAQVPRLMVGSRGNISEDARALTLFVALTVVTLCIHGYFMHLQVYVLHADFVFNMTAIVLQSICVLCASYVTARLVRFKSREALAVFFGVTCCVGAILFFVVYNGGITVDTAACPNDPNRQCQRMQS